MAGSHAPVGVRLARCECLTPFGETAATLTGLLRGERALQATPVLGRAGGDSVPLALLPGRTLDETSPPAWIGPLQKLLATVAGAPWGGPRHPILISSSNFGVGSLYQFRHGADAAAAKFGTPHASVDFIRGALGWGENVAVFSHACVSAHLALMQGTRLVEAGLADAALVVSYDLLSPFVAGGFHALKILNSDFPAPYQARATGAIGLGDGAAFAVLDRGTQGPVLLAHGLYNEMHHFTANRADGAGFARVLEPVVAATHGRRVWVKGHGTGTLEAGKLEAEALARAFPGAPLTGWKGSLGHTLGSCGLVELALAAAALQAGRAPGTVGSAAPVFTPEVALESFAIEAFDAVLCTSNAFGGAHAALLLSHA